MNWRTMTDDEVHDYAIQLWGEARTQCKKCGGDSDALNKLFMLTETLILEKKRETGKKTKGGKGRGNKNESIVIRMAIKELRECGLDWDQMKRLVIEEAPRSGVKSPKTVRRILKDNRLFIEKVAKHRYDPFR